MKKQNLISTLTVTVLAMFVISSNLFAQDDPLQEKKQIKNQLKNEVKSMLQTDKEIMIKNRERAKGFIDLDGDGFNDNAYDDDGDGIPNGQDPDFVRPQDGSGKKFMSGNKSQNKFGGNKYGPGNGTGNQGIGPKDGSGNGPGTGTGSGDCDGTGPKGNRGGRK